MKLIGMEESRRTIFLDMDGVLADLKTTASRIHGKDYKSLTPKQFWHPIVNVIEHFFATLDMLPDAPELFAAAKSFDGADVAVLTALPKPIGKFYKDVKQDKIDWAHRHFGRDLPVHTVVGGVNKGRFCKSPHDILIDDMPRNVRVWQEAGGIGILHTSAKDSIAQLREIFSKTS